MQIGHKHGLKADNSMIFELSFEQKITKNNTKKYTDTSDKKTIFYQKVLISSHLSK